MRDVFKTTLLIAAAGFVTGVVARTAEGVGQHRLERTILRDCELAGVHVIDNDTVIVCRVMKRNPTPEMETKPEEYL